MTNRTNVKTWLCVCVGGGFLCFMYKTSSVSSLLTSCAVVLLQYLVWPSLESRPEPLQCSHFHTVSAQWETLPQWTRFWDGKWIYCLWLSGYSSFLCSDLPQWTWFWESKWLILIDLWLMIVRLLYIFVFWSTPAEYFPGFKLNSSPSLPTLTLGYWDLYWW